ncbi:MAG: hypothetical protein ABI716_02555 [Candidatus Saccharibacteria bacterium]
MTNRRPNFSRIGEPVFSTEPLLMDFNEQQALAAGIRGADSDLRFTPDIQPRLTNLALRGVLLPSSLESLGQRAYLKLDISEDDKGRKSALVDIPYDRRPNDSFILSSAYNWEWRQDNRSKPTNLENYAFMDVIQNRLKIDRLFEPLMDQPDLTGIEVAHLLYRHLEHSATTRISEVEYATTDIIAGGQDYFGGVETTLVTRKTNNRIRQRLSVAASSLIGDGFASVKKEYSYAVEAVESKKANSIKSAGGFVTISSQDGIAKSQLDFFAKADQIDNHPLDALNGGIARIRNSYGIGRR